MLLSYLYLLVFFSFGVDGCKDRKNKDWRIKFTKNNSFQRTGWEAYLFYYTWNTASHLSAATIFLISESSFNISANSGISIGLLCKSFLLFFFTNILTTDNLPSKFNSVSQFHFWNSLKETIPWLIYKCRLYTFSNLSLIAFCTSSLNTRSPLPFSLSRAFIDRYSLPVPKSELPGKRRQMNLDSDISRLRRWSSHPPYSLHQRRDVLEERRPIHAFELILDGAIVNRYSWDKRWHDSRGEIYAAGIACIRKRSDKTIYMLRRRQDDDKPAGDGFSHALVCMMVDVFIAHNSRRRIETRHVQPERIESHENQVIINIV